MGETMTTSGMTEGQINRACEIFRAQLVKHSSELPSEAVQKALGQAELGTEWLAVLQKRVDAISNMIVRHVKVDRSRSPQQALVATERVQYTDKSVVATMPRGEGKEVDVYFFKPRPEAYDKNGWLSEEALEREYEFNNLKPDPVAQAQANADDSALADEYPNGSHWKDDKGRWCYATFCRHVVERSVIVNRSGYGWLDYWRFAGVSK